MSSRACFRRTRGVSIVEALVAMAIMAFGMLGLVGLQASMRLNADIAKQRSEATRIAQAQMENWRSYGSLAGFEGSVVDTSATAASGPAVTNTSYVWAAAVTPDASASNVPPLRTVTVTVSWEDRASEAQSVSLTSQVAGVDPALVGGLATPAQGGPVRRAYGRHLAVPRGAQNMGNGTSRYRDPGGSNVGWVINNATGYVVQVCDRDFGGCVAANLALVSGYINFSVDGEPQSELPSSASFDVNVVGDLTEPVATVDCFVERFPFYVAYYCAMPLDGSDIPNFWSGQVLLEGGGLALAASAADATPTRHRVCRYTPTDTDTPSGGNVEHPLVYSHVTSSLGNQNFLVISAGNGSTTWPCPDDGPSTFVNTNTYLHQPR